MPGAGAWPLNPGKKLKGAYGIPEFEGKPSDVWFLLVLVGFIFIVAIESLN